MALRIGGASKIWGAALSVALHGALFGALAYQANVRQDARPTTALAATIVEISLVPSGVPLGGRPPGAVFSPAEAVKAESVSNAGAGPLSPIASQDLTARPGSAGSTATVGALEPGPTRSAEAMRAEGLSRARYQAELFAHVLKYRYYPDEARADRLRGVARIQFAMSRDGRVMAVWVKQSSGFSVLDDAALGAIRRAEPLPAIPKDLPGEMEILLPLDFIPPRAQLAAG